MCDFQQFCKVSCKIKTFIFKFLSFNDFFPKIFLPCKQRKIWNLEPNECAIFSSCKFSREIKTFISNFLSFNGFSPKNKNLRVSYHVSNGRYGIRSRMNVRVGMTVTVMHMFMLTYVDVLNPL